MNIIEATKELKNGKYIKRKEWVGFIFVLFNNNSLLFKYSKNIGNIPIINITNRIVDLNLNLNDILADDWEVVE